jgi:hypothetical protein
MRPGLNAKALSGRSVMRADATLTLLDQALKRVEIQEGER